MLQRSLNVRVVNEILSTLHKENLIDRFVVFLMSHFKISVWRDSNLSLLGQRFWSTKLQAKKELTL